MGGKCYTFMRLTEYLLIWSKGRVSVDGVTADPDPVCLEPDSDDHLHIYINV